ncbi:MAG: DNA polymerase III subunit delta [Thermodesulfobacteriota bacterium]
MSRPGFNFCICPDSELIRSYISKQLQGRPETWKQKVFWGDEELSDAFWESFNHSDLFGECRAIVLRRAHKLKASDWKRFHFVLNKYRRSVWPFFCLEGEWEKGKPKIPAELKKQKFWKLAEEKKWIWQYPGLTRQSLNKYLRDWAANREIEISADVLAVAADILPLDASHLKNELAKLELHAGEKNRIESVDLKVLALQPDMDIFSFLRSLQENADTVTVWKQVLQGQLGADSNMAMQFLGLLLREARILWQLKNGEEDKVKMPGGAKSAKKKLVQKMGNPELAGLWSLMLEAEYGIKSGEYSPDQAMDLLLARVVNVFR